MKKIFRRENITLILLVTVLGHNIFLQTKVDEAISEASDAANYASNAEDQAGDAANYASNAAYNAREAADNAREAADNAFANVCNYCPSGY
tara:strand:- start:228 stop:500 length:273 start_codon:yes stop_codon:yes gene_type:complete